MCACAARGRVSACAARACVCARGSFLCPNPRELVRVLFDAGKTLVNDRFVVDMGELARRHHTFRAAEVCACVPVCACVCARLCEHGKVTVSCALCLPCSRDETLGS